MKSFIITIAFLISGLTLLAQHKDPQSNFSTTIHNFGDIKEEGGIVSHTFEITNTGASPLIINRVATSCGCTASEWTKEPILPGAKGTLTASYNPLGRPGPFVQNITVFSNASASGLVISLRGQVTPKPKTVEDIYRRRIGDLGLTNSHLSLGRVFINQIRTDTLMVYNFGSNPLTLSFESIPKHLSIKSTPQTLKPKEEGMILVSFDSRKIDDWGFVVDRIRIMINKENIQGNLLSVSANIEEDFTSLSDKDLANAAQISFNETQKDFGNVTEGDVIEHEFVFTNTGKSNLIIRKIKSSCGCTTASPKVSVIKPGEQSSLSASFRTSGFTGRQSKTITVISNDPKRSTMVLRLSGTVAKK
jgi:hypothetical protein